MFSLSFALCLLDLTLLAAGRSLVRTVAVDDPGSLSFAARTQVVAQSGGTANFFVARIGGSSGNVTVSYKTAGGNAVPGVDYAATHGTLTWLAGDLSNRTVSVKILDVTPSDVKKTFHLALSEPSAGAQLGEFPIAIVSIKNTFVAPSTLPFDWSTWKLTLPVDMYRQPNPSVVAWTVQPRELVAGFADDYFFADPDTQEAVFTAPANGAATTPGGGSDHTRSELREVWNGGDSNGDWNNNVGGALTGSLRVLSVASGSTQATFAQIHGQQFAFALLIFRASKSSIELKVYDANADGASATTYTVSKPVLLGDAIDYSLVFYDNAVRATVNGNLTIATVDNSWLNTPVYFKAGAYHAVNNVGNPDGDATVVAYRSLSIDHST